VASLTQPADGTDSQARFMQRMLVLAMDLRVKALAHEAA